MNDIYQAIPHRPPFLFVDEVVEINDNAIVAKRKILDEEPHFAGHYPGNPIMPGVLLCEAVFQTSAILLVKKLSSSEEGLENRTPILSRINQAKFKNMVKPGDTITIAVEYKETLQKFHFLKGKITNDEGKLVMTIEFALALIEE